VGGNTGNAYGRVVMGCDNMNIPKDYFIHVLYLYGAYFYRQAVLCQPIGKTKSSTVLYGIEAQQHRYSVNCCEEYGCSNYYVLEEFYIITFLFVLCKNKYKIGLFGICSDEKHPLCVKNSISGRQLLNMFGCMLAFES